MILKNGSTRPIPKSKLENYGRPVPEFSTMDHALRASLVAILASGSTVSPRGKETKELLSWTFRLTQPRARKIYLKSRRWSEALAVGELCWHLSGSNDLSFISYYSPVWTSFSEDGHSIRGSCYGKRIFSLGKKSPSQWDLVKDTLKRDPQSRRAILAIYGSQFDPRPSAIDQACLTTVQFLIRKRKLHCIATMRSNDAIWGLCYDVYFITMLQELLAAELGVPLGWYQHITNSIHIYKPFYKMARAIAVEELPKQAERMLPMADIGFLPEFLSVETKLRLGDPTGLAAVQKLPAYWRELSRPLVGKHLSRQSKALDKIPRMTDSPKDRRSKQNQVAKLERSLKRI